MAKDPNRETHKTSPNTHINSHETVHKGLSRVRQEQLSTMEEEKELTKAERLQWLRARVSFSIIL